MKSFLDTSVLVAGFYSDHEHHDSSAALLLRQKPSSGCTAAHCLAEFYATVTGMPGKNRAAPGEALLFLHDVADRLASISLEPRDYADVFEKSAGAGISGGTIYDALIARCAIKSGAEAIFTLNAKHFRLLGPEVASRVRPPPKPNG
ncbi:MAG TPA: PIN domain-containing protein [Rhizomicrobium sp.]|nr:PIN domain-containing protein [Rhizomicrobium sp.]